ncbi:MAG TPA: hypothetical protein DCG89_00340 [Spartobacteria bacterium]|jgi:CheY-like chemotaxis protein|nr:hypothetical protein [Spartobacteria bacterium]
MKTDRESSAAAAPPADHLTHDFCPQLNAIIAFAERLKMKYESDKNVQQILSTARELLDVINRESAKPRAGDAAARSGSDERCDVLYIEDDPVNFALVEQILKTRPALKLLQATCGENGVALAQSHIPQLILLDLNLPDIHGSDVLRRLQEDGATARIPVVVISADATASQIERLLAAGARNYLTKPISVEPFLAVVDEVLEETVPRATQTVY